MLEKLEQVEARYREVEEALGRPDAVNDKDSYRELAKEYKNLAPIIEKYREYKRAESEKASAAELKEDKTAESELREMATEEYYQLQDKCRALAEELRVLLLPKDPDDDRNVVMEIRSGAGGEEAALFVAVLYRMYSMYAQSAGYRLELLGENETELGGYREISFLLSGEGAYSRFKFESGVHRVQRVPVTESQGRIQTSTATVAVLPEAEDVEVQILPSELVMESCKSSGAGGQHVNKTESAVRLTHLPTGIVVECQEERSQFKNRDKAMKKLRAKLYQIKRTEQEERIAATRKNQVGSGDRSERIRTYNYPQGRVTDHRIGMTVYTLDQFLNGDIGGMLDALLAARNAERLKGE